MVTHRCDELSNELPWNFSRGLSFLPGGGIEGKPP